MTVESPSGAVNRETERMLRRRRQSDDDLGADGFAEVGNGASPRPERGAPAGTARSRTTPLKFLREVRDELRQVAWPSRAEMLNYTAVVFFTLVLMITLIYLLNYAFGHGIFYMFEK